MEIVKVLEKTCRVIWGRCRARAEALRGLGFRKHLFAEKVRKTKASIKQKCMIMTFFCLKDLCEVAKVSRIVMSGGFRCGAMFRKGDRFSDPPHFLPSSVMV